MTDVSDSELVDSAHRGDDAAFGLLYRRHAPRVLVRLRRILGDASEAEDVMQAVFIEVSRSLGRYRREHPFGGWLQGITAHLALRHLRARRRRRWLSFGQDEELARAPDSRASSAEQKIQDQQTLQMLHQAMEPLSPKLRVAFALCEIEGLGVTEVAQMLETSPQAVWNRVERAREKVAAAMRDATGNPPRKGALR